MIRLRDDFAAAGFEGLRTRRGATQDPLHPDAEGHRIVAERLKRELDVRPGCAPVLIPD